MLPAAGVAVGFALVGGLVLAVGFVLAGELGDDVGCSRSGAGVLPPELHPANAATQTATTATAVSAP